MLPITKQNQCIAMCVSFLKYMYVCYLLIHKSDGYHVSDKPWPGRHAAYLIDRRIKTQTLVPERPLYKHVHCIRRARVPVNFMPNWNSTNVPFHSKPTRDLSRGKVKLIHIKPVTDPSRDRKTVNSKKETYDKTSDKGMSIPTTESAPEQIKMLPVEISENDEDGSTKNHLQDFFISLEKFENKLHWVTFNKVSSVIPEKYHENGVSLVQSGVFLCIALLALSTDIHSMAKNEIEAAIGLNLNDTDLNMMLKEIISFLPLSSDAFKFRWTMRLVLKEGLNIEDSLRKHIVSEVRLNVNNLNNNEMANLTDVLNELVARDSNGNMQNTFDEDDFSSGICAVLLTTVYFRPRWRSPPTVLNGTWPFYGTNLTENSTAMMRINDIMRYADLPDWDAEAIEIQYTTPDLSLLLLVPRGTSLRHVASRMSSSSLEDINELMTPRRIAVSLPVYTLRMTLLLPDKLEEMGIRKLFAINTTSPSECTELVLSHAVQRLMFWSEAGRHAFKDDGIEWDETPEMEVFIDRPYLFYVRWKNITLMNGNFVL